MKKKIPTGRVYSKQQTRVTANQHIFKSGPTLNFFYKQLALRWQIAKQLSALNHFSLSNNINYKLKKSGLFNFVINVKQLINRQYTKIKLFQKH